MPVEMAKKPFLTLTELAAALGVSYSTAKRMADGGAIERVTLHAGGRLVVPRYEVERLLSKSEKPG